MSTFINEAREAAAQCWCDRETSDRVMDPALAEAFAKRLADWMDIGAQFAGSAEFYRGIVEEIGEMFGLAAKTADDGTVGDSVLALKVPGLVRELIAERMLLQKRLASW